MAIKEFPKALYKGNSVYTSFGITNKATGEDYEFQVGDIVRVGIKQTLDDDTYLLYKEFTIIEAGTIMPIIFTPEETDAITVTEDKGILEIELVYNEGQSITTVYQEKIRLEGVVINE